MASKVMTALGPVDAKTLGIVDAHSHVWIAPVEDGAPDAPVLVDEPLLDRQLAAYADAGGRAIVDCQPDVACGRDGNRLAELSRRSGVHLIACTGFHRQRYYAPDAAIWRMTAAEAVDHFVDEISNGLVETRAHEPVYPGFIKIAAEASLAKSPRVLFEAAAEACRRTGFAIEMHTEQGADVETILPFFLDHDVAPDRLIFCHVDKRPDFGLHRELAQAGVTLEYDTLFRPKYDPEQNLWPLLMQMIDAGLADRVVLATDMAEQRMWAEIGPAEFAMAIPKRLRSMGVNEVTIRQLIGGNIAQKLVII